MKRTTFLWRLAAVWFACLAGLQAGQNDDGLPSVSVAPASILEGNVGTNALAMMVYLSASSVDPVSVDFFTSDGTALAGSDYAPTNGSLLFEPGVTNLTITIPIHPDLLQEADEFFYLNLSNASHAVADTRPFTGIILNDDGLPGAVDHFALGEITSPQNAQVPFPVTITAQDAEGQTVTNFMSGVTAWGTLTNVPWLEFGFEEGEMSQWTPLNLGNSPGPYRWVPFDVAGHGVASLAFQLTPNAGAADGISRPVTLQGGTTYLISVDLATMNEDQAYPNADPSTAHLQIDGQEISSFNFGVFGLIYPQQVFRKNLAVSFTAPGTRDYQLSLRFDRGWAESGVRTYADNLRISAASQKPFWLGPFTNGVWSGSISVDGPGSGFRLLLEDGEGHQGSSDVFDVDPLPSISIADTSIQEGDSGTTNAVFQVTLSNPCSSEVRVTCRTSNGTATNGSDYVSTTKTIVFPAGTTNQSVSVPVIGDLSDEPDQTFLVTLSAPVNAAVSRGTATGIILNDDAVPGRLRRFTFDPISSPQYRVFPLVIRALDSWDQPATGFSGYASLTAQTDSYYIRRLSDDFEDGDLAGWTNYAGGTMLVSNVSDVATSGSRSLKITGKAPYASYSTSLLYRITNSRPNKVSFSVRGAQTNAICGRMCAAGGAGYRAFDFYLNKDGRMGLYAYSGFQGMPYVSNRWYRVDLDLNWTTRKVNCSIDGSLVITNFPFPDDPYSGTDWIAVQNTENGTSWFDDIHVCHSYFTNLTISPVSAGPFTNGAWTGTTFFNQAVSNVCLTIDDGAEHTGKSGQFDVLTGNLNVVAPAAITEGAAPVQGQVTIPAPLPQNLVVGLTSSVPSELTVPSTVIISAGQTNAAFTLTVSNDTVLDGSQLVTISAGNTNFNTGSSIVSVDDNEWTWISLTTPTSVAENAGVLAGQGRVGLTTAPAKTMAVTLRSSDTNVLLVPPSVTVYSNQTSGFFSLTVLDNSWIDGDKTVTVTAWVANWKTNNNSRTITVVDNEDRLLRLSGAAQLSEEGGAATYTIRIAGTLDTNLDIMLFSSDTNVLFVPGAVTIPAGATTKTFTAAIADNALFDGAKSVQLVCSSPGFTSATNTVTVLDNEPHHLGFSSISGVKTSAIPFTITVSARDIFDGPVTGFSGPVTLTAAGPNGSCIVQPTNVILSNGSWSGNVTVFTAERNAILQAVATNGLAGQSTAINMEPPPWLFFANVPAGDLLYSAASQRLWALVGADSTLVPIDPFTGYVEPAASAGPSPGRIVTAGDGRYLHIVGGTSGTVVSRFDTLLRKVDLSWTNGGLTAADISVSPDNSDVVAVAWACPGCSPPGRGVCLYESGIARSNVLAANLIEFGDSPEDLYYYYTDWGPAFGVARADASGLVPKATMPILGSWSDEFSYSAGLIFARSGSAYDAQTGVLLASANNWYRAPADRAAGRFFTVGYYTIGPLTGYDLATLLPVRTVNIPGPIMPSAVIRWGSNGLAFCANSKVGIVRTELLPTAPATDLAVSAMETNIYALSGNSFHCFLTITNNGPSDATNALLAVRLPGNVTLVSAECGGGFSTSQSASTVVCAVTNLPVGAVAGIDLTLVAGSPGLGGAKVGLTEDNVELDRTNNLLNLTFQVGYELARDTITEVRQVTSDIAWNSNAGRIVVAVPNVALNTGSSLLPMDPLTGRFEDPIPTGHGPSKLSIHPAGRYLYASLDGEKAITRVDLSNRVADLTFPAGETYGYVCDLAVVPNDPAKVAATVPRRAYVYQNGIRLPNFVDQADNFEHFLEFSSVSPTNFYLASVDGLRKVEVNDFGATTLQGIGGLISGFDRDMRCAGSLVFTAGGRIFDPEAKTNLATVPYSGLVAPDPGDGRVFYLTGSGSTYNLVCLNFTNFQLVGSLAITNISGTPSSLIRWGPDGLAFRTTGGQIFLLRTTMADDRDQDGLADTWEVQHFGSITAPEGGPSDDPDRDGFTNLQEQQVGLDPHVFDPLQIQQFGFQPGGSFQLAILGNLGNSYALMVSSNLLDWTALLKFTCTNLPTLLTDPTGTNLTQRFYRVSPFSDVPSLQ